MVPREVHFASGESLLNGSASAWYGCGFLAGGSHVFGRERECSWHSATESFPRGDFRRRRGECIVDRCRGGSNRRGGAGVYELRARTVTWMKFATCYSRAGRVLVLA